MDMANLPKPSKTALFSAAEIGNSSLQINGLCAKSEQPQGFCCGAVSA
jgi:hypothetical protein